MKGEHEGERGAALDRRNPRDTKANSGKRLHTLAQLLSTLTHTAFFFCLFCFVCLFVSPLGVFKCSTHGPHPPVPLLPSIHLPSISSSHHSFHSSTKRCRSLFLPVILDCTWFPVCVCVPYFFCPTHSSCIFDACALADILPPLCILRWLASEFSGHWESLLLPFSAGVWLTLSCTQTHRHTHTRTNTDIVQHSLFV